MKYFHYIIFIILLGLGVRATAQSVGVVQPTDEHLVSILIPEVSLVNVVGNNILKLSLVGPIEAGNSIESLVSDSSSWLNYSFVKGQTTRPVNHIYVRIAEGSIPSGTILTVRAKPSKGNGRGGFGSPSGNVIVSNNEQKVVQNIESSYTGVGSGNGHQLVYSLKVDPNNYSLLDFQASQQVRLVYTISD